MLKIISDMVRQHPFDALTGVLLGFTLCGLLWALWSALPKGMAQ